MADPKEDDFLDDIEDVASEEAELEMIDINEEADRLDELEAIKNERDEFKDRFVRALADAENARKRADKDRREAENYGGSKLARDLLPVYDNHKRAVDAVSDKFDPKLHEAMFEAPLPDTKAGDIIQVSGEGFMLHDRLLRPAKVGVSSSVDG